MDFFTETDSLLDYLSISEAIDHDNPKLQFVAKWLMDSMMKQLEEQPLTVRWPDPEIQLACLAYEFVRDAIAHSEDLHSNKVLWRASDVLTAREGTCYGKAHLLAALLRRCGIPAGLCYQYLREDDSEDARLVIHGLNAVYFQSLGRWIRLDARGNKPGVDAAFQIDYEQLAYPVNPGRGETDLPIILAGPDRAVMLTLNKYDNMSDLMANRPTRIAGRSYQ